MRDITLEELCSRTREGYIVVAESAADGSRVHIRDAVSGLACKCVCPGCGRPLIARKGEIRTHHFAHAAETDDPECRLSGETALHKWAKEVLERELSITVPHYDVNDGNGRLRVFPKKSVKLEKASIERRTGDIVPDVICSLLDRELLVEFRVTHGCSPEKLERLKQMDAAAIEIDLSAFRSDPLSKLEQVILHKAPRRWLHNGRAVERGRLLLQERKRKIEQRLRSDAEKFAATWRGLPVGNSFPPGPWEAKAKAYGLSEFVEGGFLERSPFKVRDSEWRGFALLKLAYLSERPFKGEHLVAELGKRGWVHKGFIKVPAELPAFARQAVPDFRTPVELCDGFLASMENAGMLIWYGTGYVATDLLRETVENADPNVPLQRDEALRRVVRSIVAMAIESERRGFSYERWLPGFAARYGHTVETLFRTEKERWDEILHSLDEVKWKLNGRPPDCRETFGLPVEGYVARRRQAHEQKMAAQEADRQRKLKEIADDRADSLFRAAAGRLGPEGERWATRPSQIFGGLSPMEAARASPEGQAEARNILFEIVEKRRLEIEAEHRRHNALEELRRRVAACLKDQERVNLWMRQTRPELGRRRPEEYCVDETTLAECLALLEPRPTR